MMYTLEDIAKKWNKTENDILRMAIKNEIELSAWWRGPINIREYIDDGYSFFKYSDWFTGLFTIESHYLKELLANIQPVMIHEVRHDNGDIWLFAMNSPDSERDEGRSTFFNLTRDKIVITTEEVATAEAKYPHLSATILNKNKTITGKRVENRKTLPLKTADKDRITSTTSFNQAIEKMYRYYYEKNEYSFLGPDYIVAFIQKMRWHLNQEGIPNQTDDINQEGIPNQTDDMELTSFIDERIEKIKKVDGSWVITTQEREKKGHGKKKITECSSSYYMKNVSKKLFYLRKKYPIPPYDS